MARWLVQLSGDRFDLEEFPRWFPDGEICAIEENGAFFLTGRAFDALPDAERVRAAALRALDNFTAVISLLWPNLRKPAASHVFREHDNGKRDAFVFLSAGLSARSKAHGVLTALGTPAEQPPQTQAQELLRRAIGSPHLERALSLWADPIHSWPRLYQISEEIERHLGKPIHASGFCSVKQRKRFRRTANTAEVSGSDARHATGKYIPPRDPMTLQEGTGFVRRMLLAILLERDKASKLYG